MPRTHLSEFAPFRAARALIPFLALTASAATAALITSEADAAEIAYAWANNATATAYTPSPSYSYNAGSPVQIRRTSVGRYEVTFGRVAEKGANVQASMYGAATGRCGIVNWTRGTVNVSCFDATGAPADRQFSVLAIAAEPEDRPNVAYAWLNQASSSSYQASAAYTFSEIPWTVSRNHPGTYIVRRNTFRVSSAVMVTAYGSSARCRVAMHDSNDTMFLCESTGITRVDTRASILTLRRGFAGLSHLISLSSGASGWSSDGSPSSARRLSTGVYEAVIGPEANVGGHVQVIGYVRGGACHVRWFGGGKARIHCNRDGVPIDSGFRMFALRR